MGGIKSRQFFILPWEYDLIMIKDYTEKFLLFKYDFLL